MLANPKSDYIFTRSKVYPPRHKSAYFMTVLFLIILVAGYIAFRSSAIFWLPDLAVEEPRDGAVIRSSILDIKGSTIPKTLVTINGYETYSDDAGRFAVALPVNKGYHLLDVRVKNRVGKESRELRHIVVE